MSICRGVVGAEVGADGEARSSILSLQAESTTQDEKSACPAGVHDRVAAYFPAVCEVEHTSAADEHVKRTCTFHDTSITQTLEEMDELNAKMCREQAGDSGEYPASNIVRRAGQEVCLGVNSASITTWN